MPLKILYKIKIFRLFFVSFFVFGQIPVYYSVVDFSQSGENLKQQLSQLITSTHTTNLMYTSSSLPDTWLAVKNGDLEPTNLNNVLLIYGWNDTDGQFTTDRVRDVNSSCHTSSCNGFWVREHVFPRSLGTPNLGSEFAGADAHNLRAIDNQRNNLRSNRIFDTGLGTASYVLPNGNWYPGDEWIGDVARIIMYMYLRYPTQCSALSVGAGTTSISPLNDMPDIFLLWNAIDPVSSLEINRNNAISNLQGNRNPFIDNPYLATKIWNGTPATDTWTVLNIQPDISEKIQLYPTVTDGMIWVNNLSENVKLTYHVTNSIGHTIKQGNLENHINLENEKQGFYLIKIENGLESMVFKVVRR